MSIRLMTAVFDRYPNGGGEMLLALSLADFADDDGTRVFPSIKQLAEKTRQSERTVQYQLRRMEDMGWLILINSGNGGRNQRREYVISPEWIKGADIAPTKKGATDDVKGADSGKKGCNSQQERVQPVAPAYNHHRTTIDPSIEATLSSKPDPVAQICKRAIDYLNQKTGAKFKHAASHLRLIAARIKDGATEDEIKRVVDRKCQEWADDKKMRQYLRPGTLFTAGNYDNYVGQLSQPLPNQSNGAMHSGFAQQDYSAGVDENGYF